MLLDMGVGFSFLDTVSSVGVGSVGAHLADCVTGRGVRRWCGSPRVGVSLLVMVQSWEKASTDATLLWRRGVFFYNTYVY